jgi:hypothetical protein
MYTGFGYGSLSFSWGDHICAVFDDHEQQMTVMTPFVSTGIAAMQRCVWVSPEASAAALRSSIAEAGGDVASLEASGQLLIISEVDFYLQDGLFEPDRTLALVHTILEENEREGWPAMRMASDVSWLGRGRVDPDQWLAFESQLTEAVATLPMVMVCQHDRRRLSPSLIGAALSAHPIVIVGDALYQNPFHRAFRAGITGPGEVL